MVKTQSSQRKWLVPNGLKLGSLNLLNQQIMKKEDILTILNLEIIKPGPLIIIGKKRAPNKTIMRLLKIRVFEATNENERIFCLLL